MHASRQWRAASLYMQVQSHLTCTTRATPLSNDVLQLALHVRSSDESQQLHFTSMRPTTAKAHDV